MKESQKGGWSTDVILALYRREQERLARGECPECGSKDHNEAEHKEAQNANPTRA